MSNPEVIICKVCGRRVLDVPGKKLSCGHSKKEARGQ